MTMPPLSSQLRWTPHVEGRLFSRAPVRRALLCGMGGSHLAGNALRIVLRSQHDTRELDIHAAPPPLPPLERYDMVICSSYSGNTWETLACWEAVRASSVPHAIVAGGGRLWERGRNTGTLRVRVPAQREVPPRFAIGWSFRALVALLGWDDVLSRLLTTPDEAGSAFLWQSWAHRCASRLARESTFSVWAEAPLGELAQMWRVFLNETGKQLVSVGEVPEVSHNALEAVVASQAPVVWISPRLEEHEALPRLRSELRALLEESSVPVMVVAPTSTGASAIFQLIEAGMLLSVALADARGVDPYATPAITAFKKRFATFPFLDRSRQGG